VARFYIPWCTINVMHRKHFLLKLQNRIIISVTNFVNDYNVYQIDLQHN